MGYIASWPEFARRAEELYAASPNRTRYVVKWRGEKNLLDLKITDDTTCLKFKTHSSLLLNRFDALNLQLMKKMRARPDRPPASAVPAAAAVGQGEGMQVDAPAASADVKASAVAQAAGGGGKKKKKKGKK